MNASAFRHFWAQAISILQVLKFAVAVGECNLQENFQSINSDNKSRNVQASWYDFFLFHSQQNYYKKRFNGFENAHMFYLNQSEK